jgi:hypothetical protein
VRRKLCWHLTKGSYIRSCALYTFGLLNTIQFESILDALGAMRRPAATPLWKSGHRFMLGTTSICDKSTVVPLGGARPVRHRRGIGSVSVTTGAAVRSVNIPLTEKYGKNNMTDTYDKT